MLRARKKRSAVAYIWWWMNCRNSFAEDGHAPGLVAISRCRALSRSSVLAPTPPLHLMDLLEFFEPITPVERRDWVGLDWLFELVGRQYPKLL